MGATKYSLFPADATTFGYGTGGCFAVRHFAGPVRLVYDAGTNAVTTMSERQAMRLRGPLGWGIADFAIDRPVLWSMLQLWLPLSRLWAAAMDAKGDPAAFLAAVPVEAKPTLRLARKLEALEMHRNAYDL